MKIFYSLSSDCDEAFTSVTGKNFKKFTFVSPYNELLKKIEFDKNNIQKIEATLKTYH